MQRHKEKDHVERAPMDLRLTSNSITYIFSVIGSLYFKWLKLPFILLFLLHIPFLHALWLLMEDNYANGGKQ